MFRVPPTTREGLFALIDYARERAAFHAEMAFGEGGKNQDGKPFPWAPDVLGAIRDGAAMLMDGIREVAAPDPVLEAIRQQQAALRFVNLYTDDCPELDAACEREDAARQRGEAPEHRRGEREPDRLLPRGVPAGAGWAAGGHAHAALLHADMARSSCRSRQGGGVSVSNVLAFPMRGAVPRVTPEVRAQLEHAAQAALDTADRIIALIDRMDGDPDLEEGGDAEPSLAAPESHASQIVRLRGSDSDREREAGPCA